MTEFLVMRAMRLKGRVAVETLVGATGASIDEVSAIVTQLVASGEAKEMNGSFVLAPAGRQRLDSLRDEERARLDGDAIAEIYERFAPVNHDFKRLATDWQMREDDGQSVLHRLPAIHQRITPIVADADAVAVALRLAIYQQRFSTALENVQAGDSDWLLKPLIDSYHTVWFEFHEELIGLAGLTRTAEAAAGRAE